jgi:very-short-patch-repair endonuclease
MNEIETRFWLSFFEYGRPKREISGPFANCVIETEPYPDEDFYSGDSIKISICRMLGHNGKIEGNIALLAQHPIGPYKIDFVACGIIGEYPFSVGIEIDGHEWHEKTKEQVARDKTRDRFITIQGITLLRFSGSEIYRNINKCIDDVIHCILNRVDDFYTDKDCGAYDQGAK